jgi:hypothetical protein
MNKYRSLFPALLLALCIVVLSACNRVPDHAKYIPKDAVAVGSVDMKQLGKKIMWNAVTGSKLFKKMQEKAGQAGQQKAIDPEATGVDLTSTMFVYAEHGNDPYSRVVYLTKVKDATKLEGYLKENFKVTAVNDNQQYKSAMLSNNTVAGWNNDVLMVVMMSAADSMVTLPPMSQLSDDDTTQPTTDIATDSTASDNYFDNALDSAVTYLQRPVPAEALNSALSRAFTLKSDSSILAIPQFKDLLKAGHDMTFWINPNTLYNQLGENTAMIPGLSLTTHFKDLYSGGGINFEKGKINVEFTYYVNDKLKSLYEAFGKENIDMDMLERLPNKHADMILAYKLNFDAVKKTLQEFNLDGLVNLGLASQGFSTDEVLKAFKGDVVISISDFASKQTEIDLSDSTTYTHVTPDMKVLVAANVGDKKAIEKMFSKFGGESLTQRSGGYYQLGTDSSANVFLNDHYMIFSSERSYTEAYLKPNSKDELPELVRAHFKGHPSGMYVDLSNFFKYLLADPYQSQKPAITTLSQNLDKIVGWGGAFQNKKMTYNAEMLFKNKEENSLIILLSLADQISEQWEQDSDDDTAEALEAAVPANQPQQ